MKIILFADKLVTCAEEVPASWQEGLSTRCWTGQSENEDLTVTVEVAGRSTIQTLRVWIILTTERWKAERGIVSAPFRFFFSIFQTTGTGIQNSWFPSLFASIFYSIFLYLSRMYVKGVDSKKENNQCQPVHSCPFHSAKLIQDIRIGKKPYIV